MTKQELHAAYEDLTYRLMGANNRLDGALRAENTEEIKTFTAQRDELASQVRQVSAQLRAM